MQFIWHTFHEEIDGFYQYVNEDIMIQQYSTLFFIIFRLFFWQSSDIQRDNVKDKRIGENAFVTTSD